MNLVTQLWATQSALADLLEDFVTTPGDVLVAWFIALRPRPNSIWIVLEKYDTLVEVTLIKFIGEWREWWQVEIASSSCDRRTDYGQNNQRNDSYPNDHWAQHGPGL